ncbi:MBOAT family O-acyltransferase [Fibrobacterota bacterium]
MLFNSLEYLVFLPVIWVVYQCVPQSWRWLLLLAASYYFYMCWKAEYIVLILISTLTSYAAGLALARTKKKRLKLIYLFGSLSINLGLLFFFKYFDFFNDSLRAALATCNIFYESKTFGFLLPVGISFYTFQTLSYAIDVYKHRKKPEKHLGKFALYVAFFPQLVAGPIERSRHLLPQFHKKFSFNYHQTSFGIKLIAWGLFKKTVIADRLSSFVDAVYSSPESWQGVSLWLASVFFAFQIYCDFSGYSDIAIGSVKNFNRPYFSTSIAEFWRRWHISLSTWFRDYVYIPMGGNRRKAPRTYFNLMVTFLLSGMWHGADWTFFLWGAMHCGYLITSKVLRKPMTALSRSAAAHTSPMAVKLTGALITFFLVTFAWIFFRAGSVREAIYIITHLHTGWAALPAVLQNADSIKRVLAFDQRLFEFLVAVWSIVFLLCVEGIQARLAIHHYLSGKSFLVKLPFYFLFILLLMGFGFLSEKQFL